MELSRIRPPAKRRGLVSVVLICSRANLSMLDHIRGRPRGPPTKAAELHLYGTLHQCLSR